MKKIIWKMSEKRDEEFSEKLFERFTTLADSLNAKDFVFEIREKYESEGEPHFHIKVGTDNCSDIFDEKSAVNAWYTATADEKIYKGLVRVILQTDIATTYSWILNAALFTFYIEYLLEYYPEWQTHYNVIDDPSQASC